MGRSKRRKKNKMFRGNENRFEEKANYPILTSKLRRKVEVILIFVIAIIIGLSFFGKSGVGGKFLFDAIYFLIGKTIFFVPLFLGLASLIFLTSQKKRLIAPVFLAMALLILGVSGMFSMEGLLEKQGGWLGYLVSYPFLNYFGVWVTFIILIVFILISLLIFWEFLPYKKLLIKKKITSQNLEPEKIEKKQVKFEMEKIDIRPMDKKEIKKIINIEPKQSDFIVKDSALYKFPPIELLEINGEKAVSMGDVETNSLIIKKTLENFGIISEISEVNIGPTVTQYALRPAEGVKLSRITALINNLSLALSSHPLRIEAPIPGRPLVGIEVPNKTRAVVRLRELVASSSFQESDSSLLLCLGKDVSGKLCFADLAKMPHLLVAGSTGSGKTICLNSLILSLIYHNSPQSLKFILVDPKRVEFSIYENLPHLLCPIIFNAQKTINALNWLTGEMERRFGVLSAAKVRDIVNYNEAIKRNSKKNKSGDDAENNTQIMPYIVLIIDELADLMATKGKEIEASIVRLSQMARAVGIHLIVATQRPSVEIITGLIKANINSRIAFQVASQIDARTILDSAGAELLLGAGDMLFISSELSKPKRIQGVYILSKEVKRVVSFYKKTDFIDEKEKQEKLEESLEKELEEPIASSGMFSREQDSLYEEAKQIVIESKKASASLLQRRLSVGYARAARLLDILENKGIIGPGDGAKPRKVYVQESGVKDEDGWEKV
ncbi:DNA translocase FtsK [Candidatus Atribacteria bacterium MT.SAG.1]|nr:DNA translocase FtsK [Candidatus Atribacteria bacterium MT.SAG.1]